jgi:hypothetical protein
VSSSWKFFKIKIDVREKGWNIMDWIDLAQDRNRWWVFLERVMHYGVF